ncbi:hypothetical protein CEK28_02375 [Xenophilus sp. AP218F]|nr:hypothetical protein CEK28_02375 [Xenophilus sp. AP218F]
MRRLFFCLILMSLAGCSTMADKLNGSLTPPPGLGYAILSLTGKAFDPDRATVGIVIRDSAGRVAAEDQASLLTDTVFGEEGMASQEGKLMLFKLLPGQYQVSQVWGHWVDDTPLMPGLRMQSFPLALPFEVKANQAVYLGQVQLEMSFLPEIGVADERRRDFGHMRRVWHVPELSAVAIRPLSAAGQPDAARR